MTKHFRVLSGLALAAVAGALSACSASTPAHTENVAASMTSVKPAETASTSANNVAGARFFLDLLTEDQRASITGPGITVEDLNQAQQMAIHQVLETVPTTETVDGSCRLRIIGDPAVNSSWQVQVDRGEQGWVATFSPDGSITVSAA